MQGCNGDIAIDEYLTASLARLLLLAIFLHFSTTAHGKIVTEDPFLFAALFRTTVIDKMPQRGHPQTVGTTCSHNPSADLIICFIHERWVFPVESSTQILSVAFISDLREVSIDFIVQLVALAKDKVLHAAVWGVVRHPLSNVQAMTIRADEIVEEGTVSAPCGDAYW